MYSEIPLKSPKNKYRMKKFFLAAVVAVIVSTIISSCSRGMSPAQAASGRQRCGHGYVR